MRSLVLLYPDETIWPALDDAERHKYVEAHLAFDRAVAERATMLSGEALGDTDNATTLRHDQGDRPVLTDGLFAVTTEQLAASIEAADLAVMTTTIAQELPHGYPVEIRPVVEIWGSVFGGRGVIRADDRLVQQRGRATPPQAATRGTGACNAGERSASVDPVAREEPDVTSR